MFSRGPSWGLRSSQRDSRCRASASFRSLDICPLGQVHRPPLKGLGWSSLLRGLSFPTGQRKGCSGWLGQQPPLAVCSQRNPDSTPCPSGFERTLQGENSCKKKTKQKHHGADHPACCLTHQRGKPSPGSSGNCAVSSTPGSGPWPLKAGPAAGALGLALRAPDWALCPTVKSYRGVASAVSKCGAPSSRPSSFILRFAGPPRALPCRGPQQVHSFPFSRHPILSH